MHIAPNRRQIQVFAQILGLSIMHLNRIPAPKYWMVGFDLANVDHFVGIFVQFSTR
jgi:hypothetical protein